MSLFEHLLTNAKSDKKTYIKYAESILKSRENGKTQKDNIFWDGLMSFAKYGEKSRLRNIFSNDELLSMNPTILLNEVKELSNYKQRIFYYGNSMEDAKKSLIKHHIIPQNILEYPEKVNYTNLETGGNVYFVSYDMVQSEILLLAKGELFNSNKMAASMLFNTYFGRGLSSIVFQEIRESKSLAYSAFSSYNIASESEKPDYTMAYVGTQANKLEQAVKAMMELMSNMPEVEDQFNQAKAATLKKIASKRITKSNIFWSYESLKKRGINNDNRKQIYDEIKAMTMEDLKTFFDDNIKNENYNVMVIGNKKDIDFEAISKLGNVKELEIDYLFNYN